MAARTCVLALLCAFLLAILCPTAHAQTYCVYLIKGSGFSTLGLQDGDKICVDCPGDGNCPGSGVTCTLTIQDPDGRTATGTAGRFDPSCLSCPSDGKPGFRFASSDCPVPALTRTWGFVKVFYR